MITELSIYLQKIFSYFVHHLYLNAVALPTNYNVHLIFKFNLHKLNKIKTKQKHIDFETVFTNKFMYSK